MKALALLLLCLACAKAPARPEPAEPDGSVLSLYELASQRLVSTFLELGRVVSRKADGSPAHQGDSLLWSGLALYALPCGMGDVIEDALIAEIEAQDGALQRFPGLDKKMSMDGALGLYRGVSARVTRCPRSREKWAPVIAKHLAYMAANGGRLGPDGARLEGDFGLPLDLLAASLALGPAPDGHRAEALAAQASAWAVATVASRSAAYRIHLGLVALQTVEENGADIPEGSRNAFCASAGAAGLQLVAHWCGDPAPLQDFVQGFQFNAWEFALQRSPVWESPDGNGYATPGLDLLVAVRTAYQL